MGKRSEGQAQWMCNPLFLTVIRPAMMAVKKLAGNFNYDFVCQSSGFVRYQERMTDSPLYDIILAIAGDILEYDLGVVLDEEENGVAHYDPKMDPWCVIYHNCLLVQEGKEDSLMPIPEDSEMLVGKANDLYDAIRFLKKEGKEIDVKALFDSVEDITPVRIIA